MILIDHPLDTETRRKDYSLVLVVDNFSVMIGKGKTDKFIGNYGLQYRNEK